ncbi:MAG: hypothetical protein FWF75_01070 [Propionibacteriaceae bacterium]|nr:hypothetical protein [Propionibacteriaceae bacterium]
MAREVIGFRPTDADRRALARTARPGETTSDTIRRALRVLDYDEWLARAREDMLRAKDENLADEPDAW